MKFKTVRSVIFFLVSLRSLVSAQNTTVRWSAFDMGFGIVNGPTSQVKSITGEPVAGVAKGTSYVVSSGFLADTVVQSPLTSIAQNQTAPSVYSLKQNYPNPFNPSTTIAFDLPSAAHVRLRIFDLLGREVASLVNEERTAGRHRAEWNASKFSSGIYFYRIEAGGFVAVRKLVLLK